MTAQIEQRAEDTPLGNGLHLLHRQQPAREQPQGELGEAQRHFVLDAVPDLAKILRPSAHPFHEGVDVFAHLVENLLVFLGNLRLGGLIDRFGGQVRLSY